MTDVTLVVGSLWKAILGLLDGITRVPVKVTASMVTMIVVAILVGQIFIH